jgi:hypothetical protein
VRLRDDALGTNMDSIFTRDDGLVLAFSSAKAHDHGADMVLVINGSWYVSYSGGGKGMEGEGR